MPTAPTRKIEIAAKAKLQLPELVFVIAGSGPYAGVLKEIAASKNLTNLFFIGLQPIEIFNELLNYAFLHLVIQKEKASDLLLPSKLTNILAVEGLAIITASPGSSLYDIVHDNHAGILVPPDNSEAFWQELNNICNEPQKAGIIKKNAGKYAARYLEKNTIINDFLNTIAINKVPQAGEV